MCDPKTVVEMRETFTLPVHASSDRETGCSCSATVTLGKGEKIASSAEKHFIDSLSVRLLRPERAYLLPTPWTALVSNANVLTFHSS